MRLVKTRVVPFINDSNNIKVQSCIFSLYVMDLLMMTRDVRDSFLIVTLQSLVLGFPLAYMRARGNRGYTITSLSTH